MSGYLNISSLYSRQAIVATAVVGKVAGVPHIRQVDRQEDGIFQITQLTLLFICAKAKLQSSLILPHFLMVSW